MQISKLAYYSLIALFICLSCTKDKGPFLPLENSSNKPISFQNKVQPIFNQHCVSCHDNIVYSGNLNLTNSNSYNNLVNVVSTAYSPNIRVVPSNPTNSVLLQKINNSNQFGQNMPISGSLSQQEINNIKEWINQGALNN